MKVLGNLINFCLHFYFLGEALAEFANRDVQLDPAWHYSMHSDVRELKGKQQKFWVDFRNRSQFMKTSTCVQVPISYLAPTGESVPLSHEPCVFHFLLPLPVNK